MIQLNEHTRVQALRWYNTARGCIGFVLLLNDMVGVAPYFKVYTGVGLGLDSDRDTRYIAAHGSPLMDEKLARLLAAGREGDREYRL